VRRRCALILVFLILGVVLNASQGQALEIFPLEEIRPGLMGVGRTVISGTTIEDFTVEVLGIIPQSPPVEDLILVRVSGDPIERSGGIAMGMSGSPVYIDGRLVGAISHTFEQTDHRVGLITPAGEMFKLYDGLQASAPVLPEDAVAVRSPLIVQGLNARTAQYLQEALKNYQIQVLPSVAGEVEETQPGLEPGSMVGVQLLRGDFQVASFGTVTHVQEDGRFIAYGHPFTHLGEVGFFAADAYVHYTMPSRDVPYKIVSLGSTIGSIEQDRAAGIAGVLDTDLPYVSAAINVWDKDRDLRRTFEVESVTEASFLMSLLISSAYQSIDATLDRVGAGTSFVRLEFEAPNLSQRMIRENLFFSDTDIAVWSLTDLLAGLELLLNNSVQEVELQHVQVDVEIAQERKTATIESAAPNRSHVRPGEHVDVEVTIRPYRGLSEKRMLRFTVPEDTAPGLMTVTVRSGAADFYESRPPTHVGIFAEEEELEPIRAVVSGAETLDALIREYMERERNNELVVEFYPFRQAYELEESELDEGDGSFDNSYNYYAWNGGGEPERVRLSTQYVLDGVATFDLNVY